jgi:hypothetical protein
MITFGNSIFPLIYGVPRNLISIVILEVEVSSVDPFCRVMELSGVNLYPVIIITVQNILHFTFVHLANCAFFLPSHTPV